MRRVDLAWMHSSPSWYCIWESLRPLNWTRKLVPDRGKSDYAVDGSWRHSTAQPRWDVPAMTVVRMAKVLSLNRA